MRPARALRGNCALAWGPAAAQGQGEPSTVLERVVVTGSHIRQTDVESALPVQVLTREDIERSGVTTVEQLLERVPANVNPFNISQTIGNLGTTRDCLRPTCAGSAAARRWFCSTVGVSATTHSTARRST